MYRFEPGVDKDKIFYKYFAGKKDSSGNRRTDPRGGILLNKHAMRFFKNNLTPLHKSVILEWTRFLEKRNFGTPNMVKKIEGNTMDARDQIKFQKYLKLFEKNCFYCNELLVEEKRQIHVDHVIPFDYVGNTEMWNSVLSCQKCNCEKSGNLPPSKFVTKLSNRNIEYKNCIQNRLSSTNKKKNVTKENIEKMEYIEKMLNMEKKDELNWHYKNAESHGYKILENFPKKLLTI